MKVRTAAILSTVLTSCVNPVPKLSLATTRGSAGLSRHLQSNSESTESQERCRLILQYGGDPPIDAPAFVSESIGSADALAKVDVEVESKVTYWGLFGRECFIVKSRAAVLK